MIIKSITRQIMLKLDSQGRIEVEIYNGYKIANEDTKEYIKEKIYNQKEDD